MEATIQHALQKDTPQKLSITYKVREAFITLFYLMLIFLFAYTAYDKFMRFDFFMGQMESHPYIKGIRYIVGPFVIGAEILVILLLSIGKWRQWGFIASAILLTLFTIYISILLATAEWLPCSCGGIISQLTWWQHLFLNTGLIALSLLGWKLIRKNEAYKGL